MKRDNEDQKKLVFDWLPRHQKKRQLLAALKSKLSLGLEKESPVKVNVINWWEVYCAIHNLDSEIETKALRLVVKQRLLHDLIDKNLLSNIPQYLVLGEQANFWLTCTEFYATRNTPLLWKQNFTSSGNSKLILHLPLCLISLVESVSISECKSWEHTMFVCSRLQFCKALTSLTLSWFSVPETIFQALQGVSPRLQELRWEINRFNCSGYKDCSFPHLQKLVLQVSLSNICCVYDFLSFLQNTEVAPRLHSVNLELGHKTGPSPSGAWQKTPREFIVLLSQFKHQREVGRFKMD